MWQIARVVRETLEHVDDGWDALDRARQRQWVAIMLGGLIALLALTLLLVFIAQSLDLSWERAWLESLASEVPVPFSWAIWLESPGNAIVLWPVVIASAGIAAWRRRPLVALTLFAGFILLDAAVLLGWTVWERQRPDFIEGGAASPHGSLSAFPSGHVSQTIVAYGLLIYLWTRMTASRAERLFAWCVLALLTAMVAFGRLRLGAHWPSDVIAGAILGSAWLAVLIFALERGEKGRR